MKCVICGRFTRRRRTSDVKKEICVFCERNVARDKKERKLDTQIATMVRLYHDGATVEALAKRYKLPMSTTWLRLSQGGAEMRRPGAPKKDLIPGMKTRILQNLGQIPVSRKELRGIVSAKGSMRGALFDEAMMQLIEEGKVVSEDFSGRGTPGTRYSLLVN